MRDVDTAQGVGPTTDDMTTDDMTTGSYEGAEPTSHVGADAGSYVGAEPASRVGAEPANGGREPRAQLLDAGELQGVIGRWREIQAQFVDDPAEAVQQADALVADLMQRLARMFAGERAQLESRLASGESLSTEELRQGLQGYRTFFERLLAA
jgi:hypothetical protein